MKTNQTLNRRDFLGLTVAGSAALLSQKTNIFAIPPTVRVRYNIAAATNPHDPNYQAAKTTFDAFKNVVKKMKDWSDPNYKEPDKHKSWTTIAEIHKKMCQANIVHGGWLFLPWHRAYLYFFEQIGISIDPNFTIPYWDWTSSRKMPEVFWDAPLDTFPPPNAWVPVKFKGQPDWWKRQNTRDSEAGEDMVKYSASVITNPYKFSFWSIVGSGLAQGHAELENNAHVHIHTDFIRGNMEPAETAALDPIFWLHHANIDRLWSKWMKNKPKNIPTPTCNNKNCEKKDIDCCNQNTKVYEWLHSEVNGFCDVGNKPASLKICNLMDTYNDLGYRYEDGDLPLTAFKIGDCTPIPSINSISILGKNVRQAKIMTKLNKWSTIKVVDYSSIPSLFSQTSIQKLLSASSTKNINLTKLTKKSKGINQSNNTSDPSFLLTIELEEPDEQQISVKIFINAPKDKNLLELSIDDPSYVGTVSFFGGSGGMNHSGIMPMNKPSQKFIFGITDNIFKLSEMRAFSFKDATISVCPYIYQNPSIVEGEIKLLGFKFEIAN